MKLFLPTLLIILAGVIFFWYIDPTYASITALRAQESQYDEALSKARDLQAIRDQLLARYNTFSQTDLERLQKLLPDHIDNVRLILDLDSMASKYGMRVRDVSIDTTGSGVTATKVVAAAGGSVGGSAAAPASQQLGPSSQPYESVILSFSVSGTYDTFRQYLSDLEKSLRLSDVIGVSFVPTDAGIYDFTVHLKTYWLAP
jgi:hypothetical protein